MNPNLFGRCASEVDRRVQVESQNIETSIDGLGKNSTNTAESFIASLSAGPKRRKTSFCLSVKSIHTSYTYSRFPNRANSWKRHSPNVTSGFPTRGLNEG